jgi:TP901 family phage tail tape measure protein
MANSEVARAEVILNGQKANATLKELENSAKALNAELRKLPTNSDAFAKKTEEFQAVKKRIGDVKQEIMGTQSAMGKFADWSNKYFQGITIIAAAFTGVGLAIKGLVDNAGKLSDSLANIRKTTGMTADEVSRLNSELKKIDTRTSREELRQIANVAGQLGIEKKSVFAFTDSIDKLNVALGDEMQGGAEGVATTMGTLRNVLTDMKTKDVADDLLRIGNAINDLSASGFATAPVLADFANRIGGVGINLGLTSNEVLGISATMQELAISTERGGTAMVKILSKMSTNTSEFAKVAGLPLEEFTTMVNTDLYGAFVKVMEGSRRAGEGATVLGKMVKEMEISGIGAAEVFSKLGTNTGMLSEKVAMAGGSLQTTNGVLAEFAIKNTTLGATLDKLGKDFNSLMSSATLISILKASVEAVVSFVGWLKVLPKTIHDNAIALTLMTSTMLIYVASVTRSMQITILNNLLMKEGILLKIKDVVWLEALIIKERLLSLAKSEGSIATKLATIAQWAWNAAVSANPIGLLIAGVTALVVAIKLYDSNNRTALANDVIKVSTIGRMEAINKLLSSSYESLNGQIRNLNQLSITEKEDLKIKIADSIKLAEVELAMMQARQAKVKTDNSQPSMMQKVGNFVRGAASPGGAAITSGLNSSDGFANGAAAAKEFDAGIKSLQGNLEKLKGTQQEVLAVTNAETIADSIQGKSLDNLEEKLNKLQVARKNTIAGSEEYVRIQGKIKTVQQEIAKFNNADPAISDADKKKAAADKLKTSYEKLGAEIKQYVELLQEQILLNPELAEQTAKKIFALEKEKQRIDDLVKLERERAGYTNDPISSIETLGPGGKYPNGKPVEKMEKFSGSMFENNGIQQPGALGDQETADPAITKFVNDANEVIVYAGVITDTLSSVDNFMTNRENLELARDESLNDKKKKNLKARLDAGLISQKSYDSAVSKMDNELAAKKRKLEHDQAVRAKAMAVIQAGINVAQGITSALSTVPAGIALAVVTGILGAVQIAAILSAPVPQAAKGRYNVTGRDDGRLYSNVPWVGAASTGLYQTPTLISEQGPEYVIDAATTRNLQLNYPGVINAINYARVPQFASGNYPVNPDAGNQLQQRQNDFESSLMTAISELNNHARNGFKSFVVYDDIRQSADTINQIESAVKTN